MVARCCELAEAEAATRPDEESSAATVSLAGRLSGAEIAAGPFQSWPSRAEPKEPQRAAALAVTDVNGRQRGAQMV